jgi:sodium-dependent dicarboxylate transporter 2/3/5
MYTSKLIFSSVLFASVGFMLPVATAPNMIAFGSGYIPMHAMLRAGFWLDVFCIFTITIYSYFFI